MTVPNPESSTTASSAITAADRRTARRWVAIALGATIAGFALGMGFVIDQRLFAALSDIGAVAFAVALVPVALHLRREFRQRAPAASRVVLAIGLTGLTLLALSGAALAVLDVTANLTGTASEVGPAAAFPVLAVQHLGILLQGVWMIGIGLLGLSVGVFRRRTSLAAIISGAGYALGAPISLLMGFATPLFYIAFLVALVGFIVWTLSLRTDLRAESAPAADDAGARGGHASAVRD